MASKRTSQAPDPVSEWLASGQRLKADLTEERGRLQRRIEEIDIALMRLSAADAQIGTPTMVQYPDLSGETVVGSIMLAVKAHPKGASVSEIREWISRGGKKVDGAHIPSYIFKMKKAGMLHGEGERGATVYTLGPNPDGGAASE